MNQQQLQGNCPQTPLKHRATVGSAPMHNGTEKGDTHDHWLPPPQRPSPEEVSKLAVQQPPCMRVCGGAQYKCAKTDSGNLLHAMIPTVLAIQQQQPVYKAEECTGLPISAHCSILA